VNDLEAMDRALTLAWRGWGRVAPNPLVGAVIVKGGRVLGEGWHQEFGGPHAEVAALREAGSDARGGTAYVTLEPCSHQGKQPPCVEALIGAGVSRVVFAVGDPNPQAAGGRTRLEAAGVKVEGGVREAEARAQNASFLHRFAGRPRPFVALKLATTLDGMIADQAGRSRWISGEEARDYVHWLRAGFEAIGVGGHTASVDNASLTVRGSIEPRVPPQRVIFDRRAEFPGNLTLIRTAREIPTILVTTTVVPSHRVQDLEGNGVVVLRTQNLAEGLERLWDRGIGSLLVEGGGRLAGALLSAGLVDRFYWIQAPVWLGDAGIRAVADLPPASLLEAERWSVVERRSLGQDTLLVVERGDACSPAS
jgi:diaminohydroxyphosphoribosylaminopyrimidine deaminase/5-amino-6-(5-phosphoribosylamino)uracil reductase